MRYAIGYLLRGDAEEYYNSITEEAVRNSSWEGVAVNLERVPHITLSNSIPLDSGGVINDLLPFLLDKPRANLTIGGFDHFRKNVIYAKVTPTRKFNRKLDLLERMLRTFYVTEGARNLVERNPHLTLLTYGVERKFKELWGFFEALPPRSFEVELDNVAILEKDGLVGSRPSRVYS